MTRLAVALFVPVCIVVACSSSPHGTRLVRFDGDAGDGATPTTLAPEGGDATAPLGGPCVDDAQCDDRIACTYDSCEPSLHRCLNVPDDTQCDDGVYCDGREVCVLRHGCQPGPVVTCEDGDVCTTDRCVEATKICSHVPRDVDGDGDPDAHCLPGRDCNDLDPTVSSAHAEVCQNGKDDNCNGLVDEQPCVTPAGDTCASAILAPGPGTYALSTVGSNKDYVATCSVSKPQAGRDVVAAITVPPGPAVDLEVWATARTGEVAVAIDGACGQPTTELACGSGPQETSVRARARSVGPGTYYAIVTTLADTAVELKVELLPPAPPATNIDCAGASPLPPGALIAAQIIDPPVRLASACVAGTGALTYAVTLTQPQDLRVYAAAVQGSGLPIVGLRGPHCVDRADELACGGAGRAPIFARALGPGTYVLTVAATSTIDATVEVTLSPPTQPPADETCGAPPSLQPNQTLGIDLSNHQQAVQVACRPGGPAAAYDLAISSASDVLLIDRFPQSEIGAVSLTGPTCSGAPLACDAEGTPARAARRNVAAGDYRVIVTDDFGLKGTVEAVVRPTVAPTIVPAGAADTCQSAVDVSAGGFFTGDTSTANADYSNGCDAPTSRAGGAADQVLSLVLASPARVVLDAEGSAFATILDVRQGPTCPGAPVANGCYVGFSRQRSFLDLELAAGRYWIIVDGYQLAMGPWDLDVRVLPP